MHPVIILPSFQTQSFQAAAQAQALAQAQTVQMLVESYREEARKMSIYSNFSEIECSVALRLGGGCRDLALLWLHTDPHERAWLERQVFKCDLGQAQQALGISPPPTPQLPSSSFASNTVTQSPAGRGRGRKRMANGDPAEAAKRHGGVEMKGVGGALGEGGGRKASRQHQQHSPWFLEEQKQRAERARRSQELRKERMALRHRRERQKPNKLTEEPEADQFYLSSRPHHLSSQSQNEPQPPQIPQPPQPQPLQPQSTFTKLDATCPLCIQNARAAAVASNNKSVSTQLPGHRGAGVLTATRATSNHQAAPAVPLISLHKMASSTVTTTANYRPNSLAYPHASWKMEKPDAPTALNIIAPNHTLSAASTPTTVNTATAIAITSSSNIKIEEGSKPSLATPPSNSSLHSMEGYSPLKLELPQEKN